MKIPDKYKPKNRPDAARACPVCGQCVIDHEPQDRKVCGLDA